MSVSLVQSATLACGFAVCFKIIRNTFPIQLKFGDIFPVGFRLVSFQTIADFAEEFARLFVAQCLKRRVINVVKSKWFKALRKRDIKEYNSDRRAHNKKWTADIPRLENEDGEEIDFWTDRAEDKRTHYIGDDICEEMDRREAEKALPPIERYIYRADREGFTQSEIARELGIDQSTVSRKLDRLYDRMNVVRLYDGERTKKELAFEIGWESFLRNRFMKNDADLWAVTFQILVGEKFLLTLHKWYYSPRELLRYSIRFLMIGGKETERRAALAGLRSCPRVF